MPEPAVWVLLKVLLFRMRTSRSDCPNAMPPVYRCGYSDALEAVGQDGCFPVPTGPGLGVDYDWDWIAAHRTALHVFDAQGLRTTTA